MKKIIVKAIIAFHLLLFLSTLFYQLPEAQMAVITQFGRPTRVVKTAGLHLKLPWPLERARKIDGRLLTFDPQAEEFLTKDKKNLIVDAFMLYQVKDPLKFLVSVRDRIGAEARLADLLYSAIGAQVGQTSFSSLISDIPDQMRLQAVCDSIQKNCDLIASENFGINVKAALIKRLAYPPQNRVAVFERMKAERGRMARLYRSEGEEEAQKIRSSADLEAALLIAKANQEALTISGEGEGKAADIYRTAMQKDAEFYRFLRSLDAYGKFLNERTTIVLPNDSELLQVLRKGPGSK
ncbi:MAG: protease modulator HflC [bacterium]|nr:protease modulator HflC [bacterium]